MENKYRTREIYKPTMPINCVAIPLFTCGVSAGFPSPADDHVEKRLDVTEYLIDQQDATFFIRVNGDSMRDAGLMKGDIVVDRSKQVALGSIVVAVVNGEFTIKTLGKSQSDNPCLIPANPEFNTLEIKEGMQFEVWGVVIGSFRRYR
jgi:DNA polymerase V